MEALWKVQRKIGGLREQQLRNPVQTRVQLLQNLEDVRNGGIRITRVSRAALDDVMTHFLRIWDLLRLWGLQPLRIQ